MMRALAATAVLALLGARDAEPNFPIAPEKFITEFRGAEGLTFNGEGRLFIGANNAIWIAEPDGKVRKIADVHRHLGQAGIGQRDILAADFGPTNAFQHGPNDDGMVWRITPEGVKSVAATGIGDPNALLVLRDRSFLVSDDAVDKIYRVADGKTALWSTAVAYPNGLAFSRDRRTVFVAQIFSALNPIKPDDRIWAIPIAGARPAGPARLVARTNQAPDGLVTDDKGRVYIADNGSGRILRYDPKAGTTIVIAEGMPGVASLVFGEGSFDRSALYATTTARGGGTIWKVRVGARGLKPYR
jgi:sugar lactone lactonase YvrE